MASVTGTAEAFDCKAASGSVTATVPADAVAVAAFWSHFDGNGGSTLGTLTLGGNSFVTQSEIAEGAATDESGVGVAVCLTLPGTGSQTLSWAWSAGGARSEGGGIILVYVKDVDNSSLANLVIAAATNSTIGASSTPVSVATESLCLPIGFAQAFGGDPALTGADVIVIDNYTQPNGEHSDCGYSTSFTNPEDYNAGSPDYSTTAAISLRNGTGGGPPAITDEAKYRHNVSPMVWR